MQNRVFCNIGAQLLPTLGATITPELKFGNDGQWANGGEAMQANEEHWESDEEFLARHAARRAKKRAEQLAAEEAAKPKLTLTVSPRIAEAVATNPGSVRVSAKADEALLMERARPTEIIEVLEVDAGGRPKLMRRIDCATGEAGFVECQVGYRPPPGARHEYDPLAALKGRDE
jgi:hypothetical protein